MPDAPARESYVGRTLTILVLLSLALVALLVAFCQKERTVVEEDLNPNLRRVVSGAILGVTKIGELELQLGEPTAKVEGDYLQVWVYTRRERVVEERALFGLITLERRTITNTTTEPVGVKDGIVVHTIDRGSLTKEASEAVEELWARYEGRP